MKKRFPNQGGNKKPADLVPQRVMDSGALSENVTETNFKEYLKKVLEMNMIDQNKYFNIAYQVV